MIIKLYPRKFDIAEKRKQDETIPVFKFVDKAGILFEIFNYISNSIYLLLTESYVSWSLSLGLSKILVFPA